MKKLLFVVALVGFAFTSCNQKVKDEAFLEEETVQAKEVMERAPDETIFKPEVLGAEFVGLDNVPINFEQILGQVKGNVVLIDIWANWCPDCIKAFPEAKKIQEEFPAVSYIYLSLDKDQKTWKDGIAKHKLDGEHFFLNDPKGMKSEFGQGLVLNWIPRYIIVDRNSKIALFDATEKSFDQIREMLQKLQ